ncbi:MAG: hypothetical protein AAF697_09195 [Pseudomonadota bacterium]
MALTLFPFASAAENTALDRMFYDVDALNAGEQEELRAAGRLEGRILEVGPSWKPSLQLWDNVEECSALAPHYAAITVAGVGSSALGAAALARNAADALKGKVLAVVSGQGMADIASEAMGGYFLFGGLNAMRHSVNGFERWFKALAVMNPFVPWASLPSVDPAQTLSPAHYSEDVKALIALLSGKVECDWLVGHSKGNLVISEALYGLRAADRKRFENVAANVPIVTFGARIAMPTEVARVVDVMGDMDSFGAFNSRPDIAVDVNVRGAWHHTNTKLPMHVDVRQVLEGVVGSGG